MIDRGPEPPRSGDTPSQVEAAVSGAAASAALGTSVVVEMLEVARLEGAAAIDGGGRDASGDLASRAVLLAWDLEAAAEGVAAEARQRAEAGKKKRTSGVEPAPRRGDTRDPRNETREAREARESREARVDARELSEPERRWAASGAEAWLFRSGAHPLGARLQLSRALAAASSDEAGLAAAAQALLGEAAGGVEGGAGERRAAAPSRGQGDRDFAEATAPDERAEPGGARRVARSLSEITTGEVPALTDDDRERDDLERDGLDRFGERGAAARRSERVERSELALWLAEAWQLGFDRPPPPALMELVAAGAGPHGGPLLRLVGRVPRAAAEALAAAVADDAPADARIEAAGLLLDSGAAPQAAVRLCRRDPSTPLTDQLRCLELAIEAGLRGAAGESLGKLWHERSLLVAELPDGVLDAAVSRVLAVESAGRRAPSPSPSAQTTRHAELADLADLPAVRDPHFGPLYLRMRSLVTAITDGDLLAAAALRDRLAAEAPSPVVAACHAARAAMSFEALEAFAAAAADRQRVHQLAQLAAERLASPSLTALRERAWLRLPPEPAAAIAHLATRGDTAQRWIAHLVERKQRDLPRAVAMWERLSKAPGAARGFALDQLASGYRRQRASGLVPIIRAGDSALQPSVQAGAAGAAAPVAAPAAAAPVPRLIELYETLASRESPRSASVWRLATGALHLGRGELPTARVHLERAAEAAPRDPVSRVGLLRLHTAQRDWAAAAKLLEEVLPRLNDPAVHRRYTRELAILCDEHLERPGEAERAFEQILTDDPLDAATLVALGALYERRNKPMLAIAAKQRAADLLPGRADKVRLLLQVAELCHKHSEPEEGRAALEQAQLYEPGNVEVQRLLAELYEQLGQSERAVVALRAELGHPLEAGRRIEVQLRLAALLTRLELEPESVVATYLEVLGVDPARAEALDGILAPARALGWWDALVRAYRTAPPTAAHLEILGEALETMESWGELARIRQRQLESCAEPAERLRRALALADLYELQLGDGDAAARMLHHAHSLAAGDERASVRQRLEALLEKRGRWNEIVELCRKDLVALDDAAGSDDARDASPAAALRPRLELLLRIARMSGDQLGDIEGAVAACEQVLQLVPESLATRSAADSSPDLPASSRAATLVAAATFEEVTVPGERASSLEALLPLREQALAMLESLHQQRSDHSSLTKVLRARASSTELGARGAVLARLAEVHATHGDLDLAVSSYQSALEAAPADRDIFTAYERLCYAELRWEDALRLYQTAITHVESGAPRAYRLSDLYARKAQVQSQYLEDLDGAIESLTKLISLDGNPESGANALEEICALRGDYLPLVAAFERRAASARDPSRRVDAYRRAALIAETHLDSPERVADLRKKLLAVDPSDRPSSAALESYYRERKDIPGLIELLRVQLEGARDQDATIALLQRIAEVSEEEARDVEGAITHYLKILELEPAHLESLEALGRIYESTERWVELVDITRRQIRGMSDRNSKALLYFRCGSVMEAKFGREEEAIRYYEAAIKVSSACLPAIHGLRDLHRRRQDWPRVIETLELEVKLWQEDKERAGVLAQIGQIYAERLDDGVQARRRFQEALAVDPDCLPANWALFEHSFATSSWDVALPLANALAQRALRDGEPAARSEFYRKRGVVCLHAGEPRIAADSFVVALEIRPTNLEALEALGSLTRSHHEVYDFESTYRELEKIYRRREDAAPLLARVWLGLATVAEYDGDLDTAAELCAAATELAPADFSVLSSVVEFHCDMLRWADAVASIETFLLQAAPADRTRALLRQAEIHGDGELDAGRAITVLREVLRSEPGCHAAYYALAQQFFLNSRFAEARSAIDRAIDLAPASDAADSASVLARYYYYKGRILETAGDAPAGAAQYRRAIEHDPGYAPPSLILSHRAAEAGNQRHAESLLIDAARAAITDGGNEAAVPLQRGLARILLATGERAAAIEAYRGILAVTPDNASDRVALAEIYAVDDLPRAIAELRKVVELDIHHAPAYRLLASFYARTGETERAGRVLAALDLLGFAEDVDISTASRLRTVRLETPLVRPLDLDHRYHLLATRAMRDVLGELWGALAEEITALFPAPAFGENLVPIAEHSDPGLAADYAAVARIFETSAEVYVGDRVPGMVSVMSFPRPVIAIDRSLCTEGPPARRFLFGWALDAVRGGYAMLLTLGAAQRRELTSLLRSLVVNERDRSGAALEIVRAAGPRGVKVLERYTGRVSDLDVGGWIDGMQAHAKRAGLLACDDFPAAIWMISRLSGESLINTYALIALGAVLGGTDLVRYYLSDDYQRLRDLLTIPAVAG